MCAWDGRGGPGWQRYCSLEEDLRVLGDARHGAPWQGGAFQVQVPPGDRSSRKRPEQLWR
jgi:hypothetical protein